MITSSVVVIPPEPIRRRIDEVRRRFDKVWADVVLGHISLIRPLKRQFSRAEVEKIREATGASAPFTARTSSMESLTGGDGLYLSVRVEPEEPFVELNGKLAAVVGKDAEFMSFRPHMTVGSFINAEALSRAYEEIREDFPEVEFYVDAAYQIVVDRDKKPSTVREVTRFEMNG
ncbi:MAG: 2'-5' RNA ligase family protein [Planctomycetes bacterium]|nr:2'-5' RNA ligase family protein [Planctomycetota bacterium]